MRIEKYGKINALCGFLQERCASKLLPLGYIDEYKHLVDLLRQIPLYHKILSELKMEDQNVYSIKEYVDVSGIGAYVVYRIRNDFVHGKMRFPEPEEYCGERSFNIELIHTATRITLMTMLMLLISDVKNNDFILEDAPDDGMQHSALTYLQNLCSFQSDVFSGQMILTDFVDAP